MNPLFALHVRWTETYDCPDNGPTNICDVCEVLYLSGDQQRLLDIAENLRRGHVGFWTEKRANELRALYPGYDDMRTTTYTVDDVTHLVLSALP